MGVPNRFVVEYPERCLELLDAAEPIAREKDLLASFSLLAAASVLVVPYERLQKRHPIQGELGSKLYSELRALENKPWQAAPFWRLCNPDDWHFSRIMGDPNDVYSWRDDQGRVSTSPEANTIHRRKAGQLLRVLRNALSHGNIVYLNSSSLEVPGSRVEKLAFLSRYEEGPDQQEKLETYRLVVTSDETFIAFLRDWATWLTSFPYDARLSEAA
jgi:hypothetical protein